MTPFLRPATAFGALAKPTPDGWDHRRVGLWRGRQVEVVYDPDAYDVMFVASSPRTVVLTTMTNNGWRRCGDDGRKQWWIRDRVDAVAHRLAQIDHASCGASLGR